MTAEIIGIKGKHYERSDGKIICPGCKKERPILKEGESYLTDEWRDAQEAYKACCHPHCKGGWGTNCYHCHHPRFRNPYAHQLPKDELLATWDLFDLDQWEGAGVIAELEEIDRTAALATRTSSTTFPSIASRALETWAPSPSSRFSWVGI